MQPLDLTYQPRWWRCRCRQILGVVMRDSNRVRRLWVFQQDKSDADMPTTETMILFPKGMFKAQGIDICQGVECSHCGAVTEWISNDLHTRLIVMYQRRLLPHAEQAHAAL